MSVKKHRNIPKRKPIEANVDRLSESSLRAERLVHICRRISPLSARILPLNLAFLLKGEDVPSEQCYKAAGALSAVVSVARKKISEILAESGTISDAAYENAAEGILSRAEALLLVECAETLRENGRSAEGREMLFEKEIETAKTKSDEIVRFSAERFSSAWFENDIEHVRKSVKTAGFHKAFHDARLLDFDAFDDLLFRAARMAENGDDRAVEIMRRTSEKMGMNDVLDKRVSALGLDTFFGAGAGSASAVDAPEAERDNETSLHVSI